MPDETPSIAQTDPEQSSAALKQVADDVATILTPNEQILYVALQNMTAMSIKKDSAVATTNRLLFYRPSVFGGRNFSDFLWEDVRNVKLKDGMLSSEIHVEMMDGSTEMLGGLDKSQVRRFYAVAQQKEQEWREKRRIRDLEDARAKSGGVHFGGMGAQTGAQPANADGPVERLAKAKTMLDQGLVTDAEYEGLKAKIIASMT